MNKPCGKCGATDPDAPCPIHNHTVGMCPAYASAQLIEKMEEAWNFLKSKEADK